MDPAFKGVCGIDAAQIVQEEIDRITVFITLSVADHSLFDAKQLTDNIKERTSDKIHVEIKYVDSIAKGANGKFKSVKSNLAKG
jgi:hypothetical protein